MLAVGGDDAPAMFKNWKITAERELVVPMRVRMQQKMFEEEQKRLKELSLEQGAMGQVVDPVGGRAMLGERMDGGQAPPGMEGMVRSAA